MSRLDEIANRERTYIYLDSGVHDDLNYLIDRCRELESRCSFKEAILLGDNPDMAFLENDRYWLTGAHLKMIQAHLRDVANDNEKLKQEMSLVVSDAGKGLLKRIRKLEKVVECASKLTVCMEHETFKKYCDECKLTQALKELGDE